MVYGLVDEVPLCQCACLCKFIFIFSFKKLQKTVKITQLLIKMAPEWVVSASKSLGLNWHLRARTTLLFDNTVHSNS